MLYPAFMVTRNFLTILILLIAVVAAYLNSFENQFQFDDGHSIVRNPYIRSISNIPQFFTDGKTFSVLPSNQSYRPLVSTSLAIDYWLGNGLDPFYFHLSTLIWFVIQICLIYFFYLKLTNLVLPENKNNRAFAAVMAAWYGLHPAMADTVNYMIQRGELYSTLAVVASFVIYQYCPGIRKYGFYLLPIVIGTLAKPPAIMFAPILFFYILFFEEKSDLYFWKKTYSWKSLWHSILKSFPAFLTAIAMYMFQALMTPSSFTPGGVSLFRYIITQPFVHLHYVRTLFIPDQLSVDSDLSLFLNIQEPKALLGFAFYLLLAFLAFRCSRTEKLRPISFGLIWFVVANLPTTLTPLAEVTNNHRMFFPFIGLILSVCWSIRLLLQSACFNSSQRACTIKNVLTCLLLALLPGYAYGTIERNKIWRSEETLWKDTAQKSPLNGRALMNYGLAEMAQGKLELAREQFLKAEKLLPVYPLLQTNLGIVEGALNNDKAAEKYFSKAIHLSPGLGSTYFYYARWLKDKGRFEESIRNLEHAARFAPEDFNSRYLRLDIALLQKDWQTMHQLIADMLKKSPQDAQTLEYREIAKKAESDEVTYWEDKVDNFATAENLVALSSAYFRSGKFAECITVADLALIVDPDSAEAYNNRSIAFSALSRWQEAIESAEQALRIKQDFPLARRNLAWARQQSQLKNK